MKNFAFKKKISVMIVEDQDDIREYLSNIIAKNKRFQLQGTCGTYHVASLMLLESRPDVLLTDLGLPDGNGIDLIKTISQKKLSSKALVLTVYDDEMHSKNAIKAGARGYLLKDESPRKITQAIINVMEGDIPISLSINKYLYKCFSTLRKKTSAHNLTRTEIIILGLMSEGLTTNEMADQRNNSPHTINTHVKNISRKLKVNSRAKAVSKAMKMGIIE